ncbi:MFS general substrate transporter [Mytilinidion resinicola]|uniref:MFS general substrate transporter n=1 Tax=Mytilinidion resinicola TaxID=574789 RepID=A0A6A6Z7I9_9PEZI|nr:MFS general substrate transporter [Mytilinidion resinicola]KAF2816788.1 MFS general substrate transporter [Mytilinidion resinicola]
MSPSNAESASLRIREGSLDEAIKPSRQSETRSNSDTDSIRNDEPGNGYEVEKKDYADVAEKADDALVDYSYKGSGTTEDPYIVTWLNDDPENPKQWSPVRQWTILVLVAVLSLCVSLASSTYTGALAQVMEEFHCSEEVALLGLSLMMIGYAFGPLLWAPLSETYGRRKIIFPTFAVYVFWSSVCVASQNIQTLLVFRMLAGLFGASTMVIPGGIVADVFPAETRGAALVLFTATPFLGPSLGPIVGGFLADSGGWRWVLALLAIFAAVVTVIGFIFIPETFGPVLLRDRAKRLSEVSGNVYLTAMDAERVVSVGQVLRTALLRPWVLLFREPIVMILTIYMSVIYGTLYLLFAAYPIVFQQGRGWSEGIGGLAFLGVFAGMMIGVAIGYWDNERYKKLHTLHGGFAPPETRLPPVIYGGISIIVGITWFAATNAPGVHWASSICAGAPFGAGFVLVVVCNTNYLIDSYVIYAASVLAANSVIRSLFGCVFPLFGKAMFENLGIHWGSAVPGFIALACFPFPILFYIYGAKIRAKCKYAAEAARVLDQMKSNLERQHTTERRISVESAGLSFSEEPENKKGP